MAVKNFRKSIYFSVSLISVAIFFLYYLIDGVVFDLISVEYGVIIGGLNLFIWSFYVLSVVSSDKSQRRINFFLFISSKLLLVFLVAALAFNLPQGIITIFVGFVLQLLTFLLFFFVISRGYIGN